MADIKLPRHEEALSGVRAIRARLISEAEARRNEKPQELAMKKMQALLEETSETEPETTANEFTIDYIKAISQARARKQENSETAQRL